MTVFGKLHHRHLKGSARPPLGEISASLCPAIGLPGFRLIVCLCEAAQAGFLVERGGGSECRRLESSVDE